MLVKNVKALILLARVSFPSFSLCLTGESLCSNSENPSPGEESPPPPLPQYEFSQKTPDGSDPFVEAYIYASSAHLVFVDTHHSITHAPAALASVFWRMRLNKLFMLVAIGNEFLYDQFLYNILYWKELFYGGVVKMTSFSEWMMKVLSKTEQCLYCRYSELSICVVTLNVILGLGNWMGSIIVATFSGITSTLRISREIVKLNFGEVQGW